MKTGLEGFNTVEMLPTTGISNSCQIELPEQRFAVTYAATNGFVKIGKIVDGVTTFGSEVDFSSVPVNFSSVAKVDYDSLCIAYSTSTAGGRVRLGLVDDLEIDEFVENAQFSTSNSTNHVSVVALDTYKVLIAYNDNASNTGKAVIGTIDEDTITFGSTYTFYNTDLSSISLLKINANKVCISFESSGGHTILGNVSGNTISFHPAQQFNSTTTYSPTIALLTNGQICLAYSDPFPSSHIEIMLGDIGTSTITWHAEKAIFDGSDVTGMQLQSFPDNRVALAISDDAGVHYGSIMLLHRRVDGILVEDDVEVVHSDELYGISAVNIANKYCNVVYSGYVTQFTGKSTAFEFKVLEELSSIYGISTRKGNLRGKATEGYIRPTLKQFFTTVPNFEETPSLVLTGYTENLCTGGVPISDSAVNGGRTVDHIFPTINASGWISAPTFPHWAGYDFNEGNEKVILKYSITSHYTSPYNACAPHDFIFQGSNDYINWDDLDTQEAAAWPTDETRSYTIDNETAYRYYRVYIINNGGSCYTTAAALGKMGMYGGVYE